MAISDVAQANADVRYGGQTSAIQRRLDALKANTAANTAALEGYGNRGREVLGQVYNVLDSKLAGNRTQTGQDLATQVQGIGAGYRDAQQMNEATRQDSRGYLEKLAQDLGVQQAAPETIGRVENLANQLSQRYAQQDATTTGDLKNWAAQHDAIMADAQGMGQQMRADAGGRFETSLLDALSNARLEGTKGENDLQGQLLALLQERGSFLSSEMARLADAEWAKQLQQAQLDQAAQQANAELALRSAALANEGNARAYSQGRDTTQDAFTQAELALKERAMRLDENKFLAGTGEGVDSTEAWRMAEMLYGSDPTWALKTPQEKLADLAALGLVKNAASTGGTRRTSLSATAQAPGNLGAKGNYDSRPWILRALGSGMMTNAG